MDRLRGWWNNREECEKDCTILVVGLIVLFLVGFGVELTLWLTGRGKFNGETFLWVEVGGIISYLFTLLIMIRRDC